jgi:hypothetical protein
LVVDFHVSKVGGRYVGSLQIGGARLGSVFDLGF